MKAAVDLRVIVVIIALGFLYMNSQAPAGELVTVNVPIEGDGYYIVGGTGNGVSSAVEVNKQSETFETRGFLKLDLSGLPANAVIRKVTYEARDVVVDCGGGASQVSAYRYLDDTWSEDTITGLNAPAYSLSISQTQVIYPNTFGFKWDLTRDVATAYPADTAFSWAFVQTGGFPCFMRWAAKEAPDVKPIVEVQYAI